MTKPTNLKNCRFNSVVQCVHNGDNINVSLGDYARHGTREDKTKKEAEIKERKPGKTHGWLKNLVWNFAEQRITVDRPNKEGFYTQVKKSIPLSSADQ